jgi:hypothetical protein
MEAVIQLLRDNFKLFGTEAISLVLVCAAILYGIAEQKKINARVDRFLKYEILFFILLANPFGYNTISTFWMQEEYWKCFMLLLPVICIAIPVTEMLSGAKNVAQQILLAAACAAIVAVSMNFSFVTNNLAVPENSYKVSQELLEVDELIREAGIATENMIAPRAVCEQIREIDESVQLMYGEDLIERMLTKTAVSEDEAEQQFMDACTTIVAVPSAVDHQIEVANAYQSNCILLETSYDDEQLMSQAGFICYGRTENYALYFR